MNFMGVVSLGIDVACNGHLDLGSANLYVCQSSIQKVQMPESRNSLYRLFGHIAIVWNTRMTFTTSHEIVTDPETL
jgi:hypothetical protein